MLKTSACSFMLALLFVAFPSVAKDEPPLSKDVTSEVEVLGQPFENKQPYARNVWDMQLFDGKIYLGHGNSSNLGPSPNAGPIPIYYFDPAAGQFATQNVVNSKDASDSKPYIDEEQIDLFKVIDETLYIPGHDAHGEGWDYGSFYRLENGTWVKYRNIPNGIHVYDMAGFQGKLFAAIGTSGTPDVLMSADNGLSWTKAGSVNAFGPGRAYSLFELKGNLYAAASIVLVPSEAKWADETRFMSLDPLAADGKKKISSSQTPVFASKMLPGIKNEKQDEAAYMKLVRATSIDDRLLYIAGESYNDHQWLPRGLLVADEINKARLVALPDPNALPMDILVRDHTIYVLAYTTTPAGSYINTVYRTTAEELDRDEKWTELFHFQTDTFARSFEEWGGDFYFGLGSLTEPIPESTGTILRVKGQSFELKTIPAPECRIASIPLSSGTP